jgi:sarcosine oxidase
LHTYDVIVIGVGGMGSAAIYHLARRGAKVLGLEQYDIPHDLGSSHGVNRIIRLAYAEHPDYVPLLRRAYELWRELEYLSGERLLMITGGVDVGSESGNVIKGSLRACREHHLRHEVLDSNSMNQRFPGYRLAKDMLAVYQPDAGFVLSERSIVAQATAALELGAEIHGRERILEWTNKGRHLIVRTDRDVYRARSLVVTAGAWVSRLVPALTQYAVPERQVLLWSQPRKPEYYRLGRFPIFNMQAAEDRHYYGFPVYGIPGFKIGKYHHRLEQVDPDRMDRECHPEDEAVLRDAIRRYFPDADGPTMSMKTCMFTNTPDGHFILDSHPESPQIWLAGGFSGHGFKFCSVVGEIMADLALNGETRHNINLFRMSQKRLSGWKRMKKDR